MSTCKFCSEEARTGDVVCSDWCEMLLGDGSTSQENNRNPVFDVGDSAMNEYTCTNCGDTFKRYEGVAEKSSVHHKFCKRPCYDEWVDATVETSCDNCGETITKQECEIERTEYQYCGEKCKYAHDTRSMVELVCAECGDFFEREAYKETTAPVYCEQECYWDSLRGGN